MAGVLDRDVLQGVIRGIGVVNRTPVQKPGLWVEPVSTIGLPEVPLAVSEPVLVTYSVVRSVNTRRVPAAKRRVLGDLQVVSRM